MDYRRAYPRPAARGTAPRSGGHSGGRAVLAARPSSSERIPALDRVTAWLQENQPEDDGRLAIAHGDFRLGNMLFHPTRPEVVAILDWELSTLGHPLADLGFGCMPWHSAPDEYGGILGLDREALRLPEEREFVERYFASAIPTPPLTPFHIAFASVEDLIGFMEQRRRIPGGCPAWRRRPDERIQRHPRQPTAEQRSYRHDRPLRRFVVSNRASLGSLAVFVLMMAFFFLGQPGRLLGWRSTIRC